MNDFNGMWRRDRYQSKCIERAPDYWRPLRRYCPANNSQLTYRSFHLRWVERVFALTVAVLAFLCCWAWTFHTSRWRHRDSVLVHAVPRTLCSRCRSDVMTWPNLKSYRLDIYVLAIHFSRRWQRSFRWRQMLPRLNKWRTISLWAGKLKRHGRLP